MKSKLPFVFILAALFSAVAGAFCRADAPTAPAAWPAIAPRLRPAALQVVARRTAKRLNNVSGDIAWGASYEMDAFLEMYRATGDESFLDDFVQLAEPVVAARADVVGQRDWKGDLRRGWLTGAHYTLGVPFVLLDAAGKPTLEIQTVARSGNNQTLIEVVPAPDNRSFSLHVTNSFRKAPETKKFDNLTPANVEAQINPKPGAVGAVRVKKLSDSIPRAYAPFTPPVGLVVLHGHHTGRIVAPLAQFAAIVKKEAKLQRCAPAAAKYLQSAEEAVADMNGDWREQDDYGYFVFEKNIPFWSDGAPEPLNVQASTGSAYLQLFDATGNALYRERAEKLARLIRRELEPQADGTFLYRYWWGVVRAGWKPEDKVSLNTPLYAGQQNIEDLSHFQLSLRFIAECHERGIVFTRGDMEKLAATFHQKIYRAAPDGGIGSLSDDVSGTRKKAVGTYDYSIAGLAMLGAIDPSVTQIARAIYETKFAPLTSRSVTLYGWGVLARMEAERQAEKIKAP